LWVGYQDNLIIFYSEILYLYGSPFGNATSRGGNIVSVLLHTRGWSLGVANSLSMNPSNFSSSLAYYQGKPLKTLDGYYLYGNMDWYNYNVTYYDGPVDAVNHPYGPGVYFAQPVNYSAPPQWAGKWTIGGLIVGTHDHPLMSRYLFVVNASIIPHQTGCLDLSVMLNLVVYSPFHNYIYFVTDNYPTHSLSGSLNYSNYMHFYCDLSK
jgi:hypothetical protein